MTTKLTRFTQANTSRSINELTLIHGIGPALESKLNRAGIRSLEQIAVLTPNRIAEHIKGLSAKRVRKENWVGQAQRLISRPTRNTPSVLPVRHHYETFTVELTLRENNEVLQTRVSHIQSGKKGAWHGWQSAKLMAYLVEGANLARQPDGPASLLSTYARAIQSDAPQGEQQPRVPAPVLSGVFRLSDIRMTPTDMNRPERVFRNEQELSARLSLDLRGVIGPKDTSLTYAANLFAKRLCGASQCVAEARGEILLTETTILSLPAISLPVGYYRMQALVSLASATSDRSRRPELLAWIEGPLIRIY